MEMFKRQVEKMNIRNLSVTTGYAAILGSSSRKTQAAAHPHYPECSLFLCVFLYHPFPLLHHCRTSQLPRTLSFFLPAVLVFNPLKLSASSSPGLQTVERLFYILLVEARHVCVHVPVVVADVALCAPIGHRAEPERWREFIRLLELWWGVFQKKKQKNNKTKPNPKKRNKRPHTEKDRRALVSTWKALSRVK